MHNPLVFEVFCIVSGCVFHVLPYTCPDVCVDVKIIALAIATQRCVERIGNVQVELKHQHSILLKSVFHVELFFSVVQRHILPSFI